MVTEASCQMQPLLMSLFLIAAWQTKAAIPTITKVCMNQGRKLLAPVACFYELIYIYNVCHGRGFRTNPRPVNQSFNINKGLVMLKLANTELILINNGPSNVKLIYGPFGQTNIRLNSAQTSHEVIKCIKANEQIRSYQQ